MLAVQLRRSIPSGASAGFIAAEYGAGASGSVTIAKPAGTLTGDLMVAMIVLSSGELAKGGVWTDGVDSAGGGAQYSVLYKTVAASDPATFTFEEKTGSAIPMAGYIQTWRSAVFDVAGLTERGTGTSPIVIDGISPTGTATLIALVGGRLTGISYSTPTGMTLRDDDNTGGMSIANFYQSVPAAATGTRTTTPDTSANHVGVLFSIRGL